MPDHSNGRYVTALTNGRIVLPDRIVIGHALLIEGGKIVGVIGQGEIPEHAHVLDAEGRIIAPGLVDIHTHGAVHHYVQRAGSRRRMRPSRLRTRGGA